MTIETKYFTSQGRKIAYQVTEGRGPAVIYVMGHRGCIEKNERVSYFRDKLSTHQIPFVCFDYAGWGQSGNDEQEWQIEAWTHNLIDLIDTLPHQQFIPVGHSMGGFLMLLAALARPQRVAGLVGMAAGFGSYIQRTGHKSIEYKPDNISIDLDLVDLGAQKCNAIASPLAINVPIRLIHATDDDLVPSYSSESILKHAVTKDVQLDLLKNGNHSMKDAWQLDIIIQGILDVYQRSTHSLTARLQGNDLHP